ncbi:DNA-directed DNA polymerase [Tanacetum coccineum]
MICSTTRRLFEPLDEPEREIHRRRKGARRHPPNESLNIVGRNLFNDGASSSGNAEPAITPVPKTIHEHSLPNQAGFQNSITFLEEHTGEVLDARDIWLIQSVCEFHGLEIENPYDHIRLFLSIVDNIRADGATRDASRLRFFHFTLKGEAKKWLERLSPIHATLWEQLSSHFLNKFFPPKRTAFNRLQILRFRQAKDEPIQDAWRRFRDLLRKTPHHGINRWLLVQLFYDNMIPEDKGKFSQFVKFKFASLYEDEGWDRIEEFVQYQEDSWDDPLSYEYVSLDSELTKPTMEDQMKRSHQQLSYLTTLTRRKSLKNAYLICDICGRAHEADECDQNMSHEQVFLSGGDIYDDPSLLKYYQNNDIPPWGNYIKEEGRRTFTRFFEVFTALGRKTSPSDSALAITTRSGTTTRDSPYPASHTSTLPHEQASNDEIGSKEPPVNPGNETQTSPTYYQPSKSSDIHFPSRLKKQEKKDEDEKLLNIFKQIHINLPFLEAMIHMPKGAKVLKDLLSHKEKLEKAASSVKLYLGASINLMPYSLFRKLGISELKPTNMSIQLADRSLKYPIGVCENLLVKINKFIYPVDFVVLEMDKDKSVPIILGRLFLATARAVIDVHDGRMGLRVGKETVTFNIGKSIKGKQPHSDYLYCADQTVIFVHDQWMDTVHLDGKWEETDQNHENAQALSFHLRHEVEPLEWRAPENRLKPSIKEPPKLELKELLEHLEYAFLQGDD